MRLGYLTSSATGLACVLFFAVSLHALCPAQVDTNGPHDRWRKSVEQALYAAQSEQVEKPKSLDDMLVSGDDTGQNYVAEPERFVFSVQRKLQIVPPAIMRGNEAPELDIAEWLNCAPTSLASLHGKIVVLIFSDLEYNGARRASGQLPDEAREKQRDLIIQPTIESSVAAIDLQGVSLAEALGVVLEPVGLDFKVLAGFIWVSRPDVLQSQTFGPIEDRLAVPAVDDEQGASLVNKLEMIQDRLADDINLHFAQGTDIRDILWFLSEFLGIGVILDERVMLPPAGGTARRVGGIDPTVDEKVHRVDVPNMPVSDAMVAILEPMGLDYRVLPEFIWVSRPDVLQAESFEPLETRFTIPHGEGPDTGPLTAETKRMVEKLHIPISVDYGRGTDIRDILPVLSEMVGVDVVLDERVMLPPAGGTVKDVEGIEPTIDGQIRGTYFEDVPLTDALIAICKPLGLDYRIRPECVWISTPEVLAQERRFRPSEPIPVPPVAKRKESPNRGVEELKKKLETEVTVSFDEGTNIRNVLRTMSRSGGVRLVLDERVMLPFGVRAPSRESLGEALVLSLNELHDKYSAAGAEILFVHTSDGDPVGLRQYVADKSIRYRVALDTPASGRLHAGATFEKYGARILPAIYVIDRKGKIRYQDIPLAAVSAAVKTLLQSDRPNDVAEDQEKVQAKVIDEPPFFNDDIQDLAFTKIEQANLPGLLKAMKIENRDLVSADQLDNLLRVLKENIWAFTVGSTDLILADRLRAPYELIPERAEFDRKLVMEKEGIPESGIPEDPQEFLRIVISRQYGGGEGGPGYRHLYYKLSSEGSRFTFRKASSVSKSLGEEMHEQAMADTIRVRAMVVANPRIQYKNSPEKVLQKHKSLLYVDIRLATEDEEKGDRYSRLKRYYWSPDDTTWLPTDVAVVSDRMSTRGLRFEFF